MFLDFLIKSRKKIANNDEVDRKLYSSVRNDGTMNFCLLSKGITKISTLEIKNRIIGIYRLRNKMHKKELKFEIFSILAG